MSPRAGPAHTGTTSGRLFSKAIPSHITVPANAFNTQPAKKVTQVYVHACHIHSHQVLTFNSPGCQGVTYSHISTKPSLSPTATSFVPGTHGVGAVLRNQVPPMAQEPLPVTVVGPNNTITQMIPFGLKARSQHTMYPTTQGPVQGPILTPVSTLVANSVPEAPDSSSALRPFGPEPIGNTPSANLRVLMLEYGVFSTEEALTRAFVLVQLPLPLSYEYLITIFNVSQALLTFYPLLTQYQHNRFPSLEKIDASHLQRGVVYVNFADANDAKQAFTLGTSIFGPGHVHPTSQKFLAHLIGVNPELASDHEGEVLVTVVRTPGTDLEEFALDVERELFCMLSTFGQVKAVRSLDSLSNAVFQFRVEFCSTAAASNATNRSFQWGHPQIATSVHPPTLLPVPN